VGKVLGKRRRYFILGGIAGPVVFALLIIAADLLHPEFDFTAQAVSQLGGQDARYGWVFNTGAITYGLLLIALAWGLGAAIGDGRKMLLLAGPLAIYGMATMLVGVLEANPGLSYAPPNLRDMVHDSSARAALAAAGMAMLMARYTMGGHFKFGWFSRCAFAAATTFGLFYLLNIKHEWNGLWERLFVAVLLLWVEVLSIFLWILAERRARQPPYNGA